VIAERVRKNGGEALTGIGAIAAAARIKDQPRADLAAEAMIAELRDDNATLVEVIREVKAAAGAAGDNATEGLSDDWTDQAQTRVWFLSSLLG
jgi:starvation-inducible DNA-binding protein